MLPAPGTMVNLSPSFTPPILKGIKVEPINPMRFDFILDKGNSDTSSPNASDGDIKQESTKLIKYFLASITIPEKDLWVNLSPYEKQRIIPQIFGQTEMGRDLLAEDYILKQVTASLIYPEGGIGKKFWKKIYDESAKKFGTTNVPVSTFNKVWIVPDRAQVYENVKAGTAYIIESRLKVMLEQDYLALGKNQSQADKPLKLKAPQGNHSLTNANTNELGSQILREIVIPELTREVNHGQNFAQLRQVYNSLVLATWYKNKIKDSILSQVYSDRNKINGILPSPNALIGDPGHIYQCYLQAFKKGVYNYIKEDQDPISRQFVPRKYFSGGVLLDPNRAMSYSGNGAFIPDNAPGIVKVAVDFAMANKGLNNKGLAPIAADRAMTFSDDSATSAQTSDYLGGYINIIKDPKSKETLIQIIRRLAKRGITYNEWHDLFLAKSKSVRGKATDDLTISVDLVLYTNNGLKRPYDKIAEVLAAIKLLFSEAENLKPKATRKQKKIYNFLIEGEPTPLSEEDAQAVRKLADEFYGLVKSIHDRAAQLIEVKSKVISDIAPGLSDLRGEINGVSKRIHQLKIAVRDGFKFQISDFQPGQLEELIKRIEEKTGYPLPEGIDPLAWLNALMENPEFGKTLISLAKEKKLNQNSLSIINQRNVSLEKRILFPKEIRSILESEFPEAAPNRLIPVNLMFARTIDDGIKINGVNNTDWDLLNKLSIIHAWNNARTWNVKNIDQIKFILSYFVQLKSAPIIYKVNLVENNDEVVKTRWAIDPRPFLSDEQRYDVAMVTPKSNDVKGQVKQQLVINKAKQLETMMAVWGHGGRFSKSIWAAFELFPSLETEIRTAKLESAKEYKEHKKNFNHLVKLYNDILQLGQQNRPIFKKKILHDKQIDILYDQYFDELQKSLEIVLDIKNELSKRKIVDLPQTSRIKEMANALLARIEELLPGILSIMAIMKTKNQKPYDLKALVENFEFFVKTSNVQGIDSEGKEMLTDKAKKIKLTYKFPSENFIVRANPWIILMAIERIAENAVEHGVDPKDVVVEFWRHESGEFSIKITNPLKDAQDDKLLRRLKHVNVQTAGQIIQIQDIFLLKSDREVFNEGGVGSSFFFYAARAYQGAVHVDISNDKIAYTATFKDPALLTKEMEKDFSDQIFVQKMRDIFGDDVIVWLESFYGIGSDQEKIEQAVKKLSDDKGTQALIYEKNAMARNIVFIKYMVDNHINPGTRSIKSFNRTMFSYFGKAVVGFPSLDFYSFMKFVVLLNYSQVQQRIALDEKSNKLERLNSLTIVFSNLKHPFNLRIDDLSVHFLPLIKNFREITSSGEYNFRGIASTKRIVNSRSRREAVFPVPVLKKLISKEDRRNKKIVVVLEKNLDQSHSISELVKAGYIVFAIARTKVDGFLKKVHGIALVIVTKEIAGTMIRVQGRISAKIPWVLLHSEISEDQIHQIDAVIFKNKAQMSELKNDFAMNSTEELAYKIALKGYRQDVGSPYPRINEIRRLQKKQKDKVLDYLTFWPDAKGDNVLSLKEDYWNLFYQDKNLHAAVLIDGFSMKRDKIALLTLIQYGLSDIAREYDINLQKVRINSKLVASYVKMVKVNGTVNLKLNVILPSKLLEEFRKKPLNIKIYKRPSVISSLNQQILISNGKVGLRISQRRYQIKRFKDILNKLAELLTELSREQSDIINITKESFLTEKSIHSKDTAFILSENLIELAKKYPEEWTDQLKDDDIQEIGSEIIINKQIAIKLIKWISRISQLIPDEAMLSSGPDKQRLKSLLKNVFSLSVAGISLDSKGIPLLGVTNKRDEAMSAPLKTANGGIDLSSAKVLGLDDGQGIRFHIDPAMLKQFQDASGFVPVIISIQPLKSLRQFLQCPSNPNLP